MSFSLYTDGGLCGKNPSTVGGTWAWIAVDGDHVWASDSDVVTPADLEVDFITNNLVELLAVVLALEAIPDDEIFDGTIFTDSDVTLARIRGSRKYKGIPFHLKQRARYQFWRHREAKGVLVAGHPTQSDLARGFTTEGVPVSKWNVWVDQRCRALSLKYAEEQFTRSQR